jgi:anti-sigma regulatory factor (Ser/Thr protein kinase)
MQPLGDSSDLRNGVVHQALIYGSDQEFMDVALPFVDEGLRTNEPTLVAVQQSHIENLRAALGGEPEGLTLLAVEDWYETSARTRDKFARWAIERLEDSSRVRLVGEPPWALGHEARVRDWARHESVVNVAFASLPATFICPYDARALPSDVLEHARETHPEIVDGAGSSLSGSYEDPREFCERLDSTVEVQSREPSLEMIFGLGDLPSVRRLVGSFAIDAGLSGPRTEEVVLAANEIATNALLHGQPPATLRGWQAGDELIVEVSDAGQGISDALAGQLPPPAAGLGGRGLWLTRLLCDAVEICNAGGCTVTMHAVAPSPEPATAA